MSKLRTKCRVQSITPVGSSTKVVFRNVPLGTAFPDDGSPDDLTFTKFAWNSEFVCLYDQAAVAGLTVGDQIYLDFVPANLTVVP